MGGSCEKQLATKFVRTASAVMAMPSPTDEEKVEAYGSLSGIRLPKTPIRAASTHNLCGLMRSGLANPATCQKAPRLRTGFFGVRGSVVGGVDVDSASWWPLIETKGLMKEAPIQGWDGAISQRKDWLLSNPKHLA